MVARAVRPHEIEGQTASLAANPKRSEPIAPNRLPPLRHRFRPYGLGENVVTTGYGMAENTLAIALKPSTSRCAARLGEPGCAPAARGR